MSSLSFVGRVAMAVEAHGGRYLVRGGATEVIEGEWMPHRIVVVEFDNGEQARTWLNSPEYIEIKEIRTRSANADVIIVEGV